MEHDGRLAAESQGPTITIGEILVELMGRSRGHGFKEPQALIGPFASGAPAIFIDQVAKLGADAGIISAVGADDFGQLNIDRLSADGVDISAIEVLSDWPTGTAFVRYRPDGARDFVFNIARSAASQTRLTAPAEVLISRAGHVHVMGSALAIPRLAELILTAVESVKARSGTVSFDPNLRKELIGADPNLGRHVEAVLAVTDLLLPSGDELVLVAGVNDEASAVDALLSRGIAEIVLKRGAAGATVFSRSAERIDTPAFAVREIDPTGAGDCFGAAYLTCRRRGMALDKALAYATAAGACAVMHQGPMEGASDFDTLDRLIRS
ncbi:sugar kinase [Rhizobium sp. YIM 134829]|uniref:tagatose kinase n=1 Tax=Rhizobium sp. YIM 134829 TaxID=3390453 RepID=UPI00397D132D